MKAVRVTRYISDCGKGYWNKNACACHEIKCKCWTNPKYKTCMTCKFRKTIIDSNGMEHEPQYLQEWKQNSCTNPIMKDEEFTPAHEKASDLCINCPKWESKKTISLTSKNKR